MFKRKAKSDKPAKAAKPAKPVKAAKEKAPKAKKRPVIAGSVKKPPSDIYTAMLVMSLVAVLTSCILLVMELSRYGSYPWWKAG